MKKKRISLFVMIILAMLIIVGVGVVKWSGKKSDKNSETTTMETPEGYISHEADPNGIVAEFNITVPEPLPDGYYLSMGCSLTGWNPLFPYWKVKKVDDTHYKLTVDMRTDLENYVPDVSKIIKDGKYHLPIQYKWTLQRKGLTSDNMWSMVELSKDNEDIDNRTVILTNGKNVFNDEIAAFKKEDENVEKDATVTGTLEQTKLKTDGLLGEDTRNIRIWLPNGYDAKDKSKKYPVLYMHDGQNLFDNSTAFAGEWGIDETITDEMQKGYEGCIVVGIDSVKDSRIKELSPKFSKEEGTGEKYAKFIVEKVKPYIDSHYNTKPERQYTGIGGSSMGGDMSLYMGMKYNDIFGYEVCFSPALVYWKDEDLVKYMKEMKFNEQTNLPKIYIYAGGTGIGSGAPDDEASLTRYVDFLKTNLIENGYPSDQINTYVDQQAAHNEQAWSKYFKPAFEWLVGMGQ